MVTNSLVTEIGGQLPNSVGAVLPEQRTVVPEEIKRKKRNNVRDSSDRETKDTVISK